jgi:RHS repeat-associated protein
LAELNSTNNAVIRSYLWGPDLSGSLQGAGGIRGLIAVKPSGGSAHFPTYDANGNITSLTDSSDGNTSAIYEYGPFGELIRATGPTAHTNPFRFSTKFQDDETGLNYYGFRFYSPFEGRWLSQDPLGEYGALNLYGFVGNSPPNAVDPNGEFAHILVGTAVGFAVGGGFSVISDLYHGRDIDWYQAAINGTEGAIAGAVASATFGASLPASGWALAGRGAISGLAGDVASQAAGLYAGTRKCFNISEAVASTALGAGAPFLGKALAAAYNPLSVHLKRLPRRSCFLNTCGFDSKGLLLRRRSIWLSLIKEWGIIL